MKLSEIKTFLKNQSELSFQLPNGELVPENFHVTEVGKVTRHFIDCGGKERKEEGVNFQLWATVDYNHRLHPEKLLQIITLSERVLDLQDGQIEVEYQGDNTIGKFGLAFEGNSFLLTSKQTDCLAKDKCDIPEKKPRLKMANLPAAGACTPGGGCC
jgi:hypothetical protein